MVTLTDLWCLLITGEEEFEREKLEMMRPIVSMTGGDDVLMYNHLAEKMNCPKIDQV